MRLTEKNGRQVAPGVWQLNRDMFIVRAQPVDALTGRRRNVRRVMHGATLSQALLAREQILGVEPCAPPLPPAPLPIVPPAPPVQPVACGPTLGTFAEEWLKRKVKRGDLEGSTRRRYELAIARLSQELVRCPLEQLRPSMVENWMLASRGGDLSYSSVTINSWRQVLRTILNDAVIQGLVTVNAVGGTRPLRVEVDLEEPNALSPAKLVRVLRAIEDSDIALANAAWTQAFTGLRWQEVSALRWEDFNPAERTLTIRRKAVGGKLLPSTKTRRLRIVGVPQVLVERFLDLQERLAAHPGGESGLMFPSSAGTPICSARISEMLRKACGQAGITERFTSHGLRRSMTDLLRDAQVDPVVAKAIVGHATDRMREHYSTVRAADARSAGDRVAGLLVAAGL